MRKRRKKGRPEEKRKTKLKKARIKINNILRGQKASFSFPFFLHDDGLAVTTVKKDDDVEKESPLNNLVVEF